MFTKLKNLKKSDEGFTIIEVMIVLAIAGLILLIVFLAVPALQRNSRNTQRKNDVQNVLGAISTYNSNNNGANPTAYADISPEVKSAFYTSSDITWGTTNGTIATVDTGRMYVSTGAKCNTGGTNFGGSGATSRNVAVLYTIENAGSTATRCQEG